MAENVTPVTLEVKDFAKRQVLMVDYKFEQATDREGQIAGIPRGGRVNIRVKALNDGNSELLQWMISPNDPRDFKITFYNRRSGKTVRSISRRWRLYARNSRTVQYLSTILGHSTTIAVEIKKMELPLGSSIFSSYLRSRKEYCQKQRI